MVNGAPTDTNIISKVAGVGVHVLTASGAVCALFALRAVTNNQIELAFFWLGLALIIDGLDGPVARRIRVADRLPRFSGERLDLIVDYLNYVAVPAFMLAQSGLVPTGTGIWAGSVILLTSLFHFADKESKTIDGYFVGFPAIWNVVVFFLYVIEVSEIAALIVIHVLALLIFVPFKWVHPIRVKWLRLVTLGFMCLWTGTAVTVLVAGFPAGWVVKLIFYLSAAYFVSVGLSRTFKPIWQTGNS